MFRLIDRLVKVERDLVHAEEEIWKISGERDSLVNSKDQEIMMLQTELNHLKGLILRRPYQVVGKIDNKGILRFRSVKVIISKLIDVCIFIFRIYARIRDMIRAFIKTLFRPVIHKTVEEVVIKDDEKEDQTSPVEVNTLQDGVLNDLYVNNFGSSDKYEALDQSNIFNISKPPARLIAFYLPQFHPIPENDLWWGKGFTEWTNVTKSLPLFKGHYQPRLPGELGHYDLRVPSVLKRQSELAKIAGIEAFCFYFYWFNGQTLLEKPLQNILDDKSIDINYCLCWANENWTRAWDGQDKEILMEQKYTKENNHKFIKYVSKYLRDPRYIRVDGKPLLIIYRINHFPRPGETVKIFRDYCRNNGIGEIHIAGVQGFGMDDPTYYGCDSSVEFPPHSMRDIEELDKEDKVVEDRFKDLRIYNLKKFLKERKYIKNSNREMYRGVMLNWDNTPRKGFRGVVFQGLTPTLYYRWLKDVIHLTFSSKTVKEKLVFINAWNEWGEGTYLEPDRKFGYTFLNHTKKALLDSYLPPKKIICVGHDAHRHGAQQLLLAIVKELKNRFHYDIKLILLEGGVLEKEYSQYADVSIIEDWDKEKLEEYLRGLKGEGFDNAIFNTVITGRIAKLAHECKINFISLIHELPEIIKEKKAVNSYNSLAEYADKVVVASDYVRKENLKKFHIGQSFEVLPQGIYQEIPKASKSDLNKQVRKNLGLPEGSQLLIGAGYADKRKGIDIFVETAISVCKGREDTYFLWMGNYDEPFLKKLKLREKISAAGLKNRIILKEYTENLLEYIAAADLFLLTSREDPFPSVALESMRVGTAVIAFKNTGGFSELINNNIGRLVKKEDVKALEKVIVTLLSKPEALRKLGLNAQEEVGQKYEFKDYIYSLLSYLGHNYKKISAVVPNYNYAHYLHHRVASIIEQGYPIYEVLVLDDGSKDDSEKVISDILGKYPFHDIQTDLNTKNSGSVYKQWIKGIKNVKGDYVWIAEADDLAEKDFLENLVRGFYLDSKVVIAYSQSKTIDEKGSLLSENMRFYTDDVDEEKFKYDYINSGEAEIKESLCVKNTIPNVSGVVFERKAGLKSIDGVDRYQVAGDWWFYLNLLKKGASVYFVAKSLNLNRRHQKSIVASKDKNKKHFEEIVQIQDYLMKEYNIGKAKTSMVKSYRKKIKLQLLDNSKLS